MAETSTSPGNVVTRFLSDAFAEYVRDNRFNRYWGTTENSIIHTKEERTTGRQIVSLPLLTRLTGNAVVGNGTLDGNEDELGNHAFTLTPTYRRNAVRMTREEMEKPNIDLMRGSRTALMNWAKEDLRDQIIQGCAAIDNGTIYANVDSATAAQRNSWNANNSDRVLYGAAVSNYNATFATALATIDSSADKLDRNIVSLLADRAKNADPHIRPVRTTDDEEYFVLFVGSRAMRDLRTDLETLHSNGLPRTKEGNPLWKGGDLCWENVIIHEIPEITTTFTTNTSSLFATAGDSSTAVEPVFLCGAQALGWAIGRRMNFIVDKSKDFNFRPGVAVEKKEHVKKVFYDSGAAGVAVQHGMVSGFVSGVA